MNQTDQGNHIEWMKPAYQMTASEVLERLESSEHGLDRENASTRRNLYGPNRLPEPKKPSAIWRFLRQFHNMLIYLLLGAAAITLVLGHVVDASIILAVVVVNALSGFVQEGKAEQALDSIRKMLSPGATLMRDGVQVHVKAEELVPGDLVVLSAGDKVPADLRLVSQRDLKVEESALTGESVAVNKEVEAVAGEAMIGDQRCMAFSGTAVVFGQGRGVVVATGSATEIGKISRMMSEVEVMSTPLLKQFFQFGRTLSVAILVISALLFGFGAWMQHYETHELFLAVISLAVAAIPEGLPAIMTITLAVGVQAMARQNAIVRHLPSIETLGSVSVICTDKTGTLTKNEMTVRSVVTAGGRFDVTGSGYAPVGSVVREGQGLDSVHDSESALPPDAEWLIRTVKACNDASLMMGGGEDPDSLGSPGNPSNPSNPSNSSNPSNLNTPVTVVGDPTEGALITLAHKAGLGSFAPDRLDTIPFDSSRKWMATLHSLDADPINPRVIFVKGAPEVLLTMCDWQVAAGETDTDSDADSWGEITDSWGPNHLFPVEAIQADVWMNEMDREAAEGHRLMAAAVKFVPSVREHGKHGKHGKQVAQKGRLQEEDLENGLVFLGLIGMMDPPRPEAVEAIRICKRAGIQIKMITGDHLATAQAIGRQLGLGDGFGQSDGHVQRNGHMQSNGSAPEVTQLNRAIRGDELEAMTDEEFREAALRCDIFARTSPEHKLRLVKALQQGGRICAMTGDGVNDAPALKQADIGIAMGLKGTEVTKEASDMVLADDHFASIANAVKQGRTIYSNLRKTVLFFLPTDGAESIVIIAALLFGITLPITPAQVLWVNMITAVTLSLALCFEPSEPGVMLRPPRKPGERILNRYLLWRLVMVSVFLGGSVLGLFLWLQGRGVPLDVVRTVAVNTLVMGQLFYLLNCRRILDPAIDRGFFSNKAVFYSMGVLVVFQLLFTHTPLMNLWFRSASHGPELWLFPIGVGLMLFALVEVEKFWTRRRVRAGGA